MLVRDYGKSARLEIRAGRNRGIGIEVRLESEVRIDIGKSVMLETAARERLEIKAGRTEG
jgi:hypothetical protein